MSLNALMQNTPAKIRNKTIIAECTPKDIRYHNGKYYVNYVLLDTYFDAKPHTLRFSNYANAYLAMNTARLQQGFKPLPPFTPYKG